MIYSRELRSLSDTESLAKDIARTLRGGDSLALNGELGAGKTTFVKFLAKEFGVVEEVSSPSFVLQHIYSGNALTIEHWDLYRLGAVPEELDEDPPKGVLRVIEWADKFNLDCPNQLTISQDPSGFRLAKVVDSRP